MTAGGDNTARCTCPENGRVADCPIARHREQWETLGRRPAAGGDRGDNTARCGACEGETRWENGYLYCLGCGFWTPVPATDRQTDEERCGDVSPRDGVTCDERPGHYGDHSNLHGHPPTLYRWPAARPAVADAVMADLGAAITEGVTEVGLLDLLVSLYAGARDQRWQEAADLAELVSGDPWNDVDPIRFRTWLRTALGGEG